ITYHHVDPSSAYTFSPGPIPASRSDMISRLTPTFLVALVYGPSGVRASNPEWYKTKLASGCLWAAGPMSSGEANLEPPDRPLWVAIRGTPSETARSMKASQ